MARLATLTKGQWDQFDRVLNSTDLSAEEVLKLTENPEVLKEMLATMRKQFRLIHTVFNNTDDVLVAFIVRCNRMGINFEKFSWVGSKFAPEFDPNDPETVVVLEATLDTLQNTFEFAWDWTVDGQEDKRRMSGMISDADKLVLLDGLEFTPWTLRWVRIKLNANICEKPVDVRDPKSSPGCALLFMSAEHPTWIKAIDYRQRFGFCLPGLKCNAPGEQSWQSLPGVNFDPDRRQVRLGSCSLERASDRLAVPSFRE